MMRGKRETVGGMKEGMKTKGRNVQSVTTGKGLKTAGKTSSRVESHGGVSGSRKSNIKKGIK